MIFRSQLVVKVFVAMGGHPRPEIVVRAPKTSIPFPGVMHGPLERHHRRNWQAALTPSLCSGRALTLSRREKEFQWRDLDAADLVTPTGPL